MEGLTRKTHEGGRAPPPPALCSGEVPRRVCVGQNQVREKRRREEAFKTRRRNPEESDHEWSK